MGTLFIISGPSGVGKSTIRNEVLKQNKNLWYSISMTTRSPRENEENNKDYYFVTKEEFIKNIKENNFFEYVEVYKNIYYGTPKDKVLEKLNNNQNVILEIDVNGAFLIKKQIKDAVLIFIAPKNIETLEKRLISRNTDKKEIIKERLEKAKYELSKKDKYDYIIINDDLNTAVNELNKIINKKTN